MEKNINADILRLGVFGSFLRLDFAALGMIVCVFCLGAYNIIDGSMWNVYVCAPLVCNELVHDIINGYVSTSTKMRTIENNHNKLSVT